MNSPDTVTEALAQLTREGYTANFQMIHGKIVEQGCADGCSIADVKVERLFRFEGESDPGDEMVVFGLVDPSTGTKGQLASGFGPSADPEIIDQLVGLQDRLRPT